MNKASLQQVIGKLEMLFSRLNDKFYGGKLDTPVITVSPGHKNGVLGWCTSWKARKGEEADKDGGYYEINICSEYLSRPFVQVCETLLHEMVHLHNLQVGVKDTSRGGTYHNERFKIAAETHGLKTEKGKSGFNKTSLTDEAAAWLISDFTDETGFALYREKMMELSSSGKSKSSSRKYVCPICGTIVRTTKEVNITCTDCEVEFEIAG